MDHCTYIDADLFFYSDPAVLLAEMGTKDILLTEHRYSPGYDQSVESGRFCVQFVTFRNTSNGMKALRWWRDACLAWCYARVEDGKFGDQKYLDDWEKRFEGVHVLQHPGGGLAPWNVQQFDAFRKDEAVFVREKKSGKEFAAVFFHFHGVKFFENEILQLAPGMYEIADDARQRFYFPYVTALLREAAEVKKNGASFDPNGASGRAARMPWGFGIFLFYYLADLKSSLENIGGKGLAKRKRHHHFYYTASFTG